MGESVAAPAAVIDTTTNSVSSDAATTASAAAAAEDPEFEYEFESQNDKGETVKEKTKIKSSEARNRLAKLTSLETSTRASQRQVNQYIEKNIRPLQQQIDEMRKNPKLLQKFARELGIDFDQAALSHAQHQVDLSKMTPEQREHQEAKNQLEQYRKQEAEAKAGQERQAQTVEVQRASEKLQTSIVEAATKEGLPRDPSVMMIMTGFMRNVLNRGEEPNVVEAAKYANRVFNGGVSQALSSMTYEQLEKSHPELLTKIREGDIKKMRGATPALKNRVSRADPVRKTFITPEEYQARLENGE